MNPPGDQSRETEPPRQGGHQQQTRIGHQVRVVEDHLDPVRTMTRCAHRKRLSEMVAMRRRTPSFFQP